MARQRTEPERNPRERDELDKALARTKVPHKLSLSDIVWLLLTKQPRELSSVKLTRNAKGDTQIEVTVYPGETEEVATVFDAERIAKDIFNRLRATYPMGDGTVGSPVRDDTERAASAAAAIAHSQAKAK